MYEEKMEINFTKIINAAFRFKKTGIAIGLLVCSVIVFGNSYMFPDKYETTALVRVQNVTFDDQDAGRNHRLRIVREDILSRRVLEKVVTDLNLHKASEQVTGIQSFLGGLTGKEVRKRDMEVEVVVRDLRNQIQIMEADTTDGSTRLFTVSLTGKYPDTIAEIVNAVIDTYIGQKSAIKTETTQDDVEFLRTEVADKGRRLRVASQKLNLYKAENVEYTTSESAMTQALYGARMRLVTAEGELVQAQTLEESLRDALRSEPTTIPVATTGAAADYSNLINMNPRDRLRHMENQLVNMQNQYTDRHPDLIKLKDEIADFRRNMHKYPTRRAVGGRNANPEYLRLRGELTTAISNRSSAETTVKLINQEIEDLTLKIKKAPRILEVLNALQAVKDASETEYNTLASQLASLSVSLNATSADVGSNFRIIDPAITPNSSLIRSRFIFHIFGLVAGLFLGIAAATSLGMVFDKDPEYVGVEEPNKPIKKSTMGRFYELGFYWTSALLVMYILFYIITEWVNRAFVLG